MGKVPRDISGQEFIKVLKKYGYIVTRQVGSHIRLTSETKGSTHSITIPNHNPIKIGTLNNILKDIADYLEMDKSKLVKTLF